MSGTKPTEQEDAIWNERHKLFASAMNNLGVGMILTGFVAPLISGAGGGHLPLGAWLAGGAVLLLLGQFVLGRLQ
jgi:hypothetical protein